MSRPKYRWRVWTGTVWEETLAVSEAKAISNVVYRMRRMGKFPVMSQFEAVRVIDEGGERRG